MRYRPPSRSPGAKRPWLADLLEEPRSEERGRPLDTWAARGVDTATVWVANASLAAAFPHDEQKRTLSGTSLPHEEHAAMTVV